VAFLFNLIRSGSVNEVLSFLNEIICKLVLRGGERNGKSPLRMFNLRTRLAVLSESAKRKGDAMNRFVIADPKLCIGCYACVAGCVENHRKAGLQAYPRLYITHTPAGTMPIQCRQCEEPACAAVCPVKAITSQKRAVRINEGLCIGCKMCALACPFGAIVPGGTPVPKLEFNVGQYTYVNTPYQSEPMFLRELGLHDRLSLLTWNIGQKTVAVKCDLCYFDEAGPACLRACPHKALSLIDGQAIFPTARIEGMKSVAVVAEGEL
jgi:hydrogenase-4 component A